MSFKEVAQLMASLVIGMSLGMQNNEGWESISTPAAILFFTASVLHLIVYIVYKKEKK